jgi:signal transduction histidine kinase
LEALRHELDKKAIRVETEFQDVPPAACHAGKINQAFLNILLNAIQASEREGLIEVRTRPDGEGAIIVEIEDHGGGIRPEHLPHIFEPFFTTKPVGAGTGLGLSVSYGVVHDQGGTIEVESVVGKGSLFRIRLPLKPREVDADSSSTRA